MDTIIGKRSKSVAKIVRTFAEHAAPVFELRNVQWASTDGVPTAKQIEDHAWSLIENLRSAGIECDFVESGGIRVEWCDGYMELSVHLSEVLFGVRDPQRTRKTV